MITEPRAVVRVVVEEVRVEVEGRVIPTLDRGGRGAGRGMVHGLGDYKQEIRGVIA